MITKKLLKAQANGVRLEMICHGISGLRAMYFSIKQKITPSTTEAISSPYTSGSLQGREFPPMEVASRKQTTDDTTADAPM